MVFKKNYKIKRMIVLIKFCIVYFYFLDIRNIIVKYKIKKEELLSISEVFSYDF